MNETDEYTHVQRRLCAVIAKSEWTSSRMRMQKSGEELRERRSKSNRTANQFLQDLLEKRTDSDLIDDNGAVDRYHKFVKYKSAFNDDPNSSLDEFDRRLRALDTNRRKQTNKLNNQNLEKQQFKEVENDNNEIIQQLYNEERPKPSRKLPSISAIPTTSTPNDTTNDSTTPVFHDDEIQELSNVQSANTSFIDSQANHIESPISQHHSSSIDKTEPLNSSTSSLNHIPIQILYAPKPHRSDGTEMIISTSENSSPYTSSNVFTYNHCYFPRSLTSRGKLNTSLISKRQLPTLPVLQSSEHEQFDKNQLYDLLDHLDNNLNQYSHHDFTEKLNKLTLSTVIHNNQDEINHNLSIEIETNDNQEEEKTILPNLFEQSISSIQEKLFYTTLTMNIDDPKDLILYTMTLGTVQLSASILLPYSILNGRRPLLKTSKQTNFKQIYSKQQKCTCQVTAIESSLNFKQFQQNDIILKINDQSVWGLTTDAVIDILKQYSKRSNTCSLTVARLCQPFV